MKSVVDYLVAARQCEIRALARLQAGCELVSDISRLVHVLQKERGSSSVFLASGGRRFVDQRSQRIAECLEAEVVLRERLAALDPEAGGDARLFTRIAAVVHGLDGLAALREDIGRLALKPEQACAAFDRLIAALLAVVFEAADVAGDPAMSRALVAMFNFMQGKELAGQERAAGGLLLASGRADAAHRDRLSHLIEAQQRCFGVFAEFGGSDAVARWRAAEADAAIGEFERLRRMLCTARPGAALEAALSDAWFAACTTRIDAMKNIEAQLAAGLQQLCVDKTAEARATLGELALPASAAPGGPLAVFVDAAQAADPPLAGEAGPRLGRSLLDMLQAQSRRLQSISDELHAVRGALEERKLIERAKGLLMAEDGLSEDAAYRQLRRMAMQRGERLAEVARAFLAARR